jgi:hypothetical protein
MKIIAILILLLFLSACGGGGGEKYRTASSATAPWITKGAISQTLGGETTPIVWNGILLYVRTEVDSAGRFTNIYRQSDNALVGSVRSGLGFMSAIVSNGILYLYGTNSDSSAVMPGGTAISMVWTTDLITWSPPAVIFTAPKDTQIYNTSATADAKGYTMVYEVCKPTEVCFGAQFLHSADLVNWTPVQGYYEHGIYTACPTIRYSGGFYYLFFASHYAAQRANTDQRGYYAVNIARSADLQHWQFSPTSVLSPLDGGDPALAATDIDLVEFNGQVRIVYMNVSQWGIPYPNTGLREAVFNGTMSQGLAKFF